MANKPDSKVKRTRIVRSLIRWFLDNQWFFISALFIVAFVFGMRGFILYYEEAGQDISILDSIYYSLQLFGLSSPEITGPTNIMLQVARFMAPAVAIIVVMKAVLLIFYDQFQRVRTFLYRKHYIVCGLGRKGYAVTKCICDTGFRRVIAIEEDQGNKNIRLAKDAGAQVIIGDALDNRTLRRAGLKRCSYVVAVTGTDRKNIEIANNLINIIKEKQNKEKEQPEDHEQNKEKEQPEDRLNSEDKGTGSVSSGRAIYLKNGKRNITCKMNIEDLALFRYLREYSYRASTSVFRIECSNIYNDGAAVYVACNGENIFGDGGLEDSKRFVFIGMSQITESLIDHIVTGWRAVASSRPLRIALIDERRIGIKDKICFWNPDIDKEEICVLEPEKLDCDSAKFLSGGFLLGVSRVFICFKNDTKNISSALSIANSDREEDIPITVCLDDSLIFPNESSRISLPKDSRITYFSPLEYACRQHDPFGGPIENMARKVHEEYRKREEAPKDIEEKEKEPIARWEDTTIEDRESSRNQVMYYVTYLENVGYSIKPSADYHGDICEKFQEEGISEEIEILAKKEHERWLDEKKRNGWKYGPDKNLEKKTNPLMVPWEKLSDKEKSKTRDMIKSIPEVLKEGDFCMYKKHGGQNRGV